MPQTSEQSPPHASEPKSIRVNFRLSTPPFSVNAYYYKNRAIKTKAARDWEQKILRELRYFADLEFLAKAWKPGYEAVVVLNYEYPEKIYWNARGEISARTFDLTNVEKPLIDLIFNKTLGIDDRNIVQITSTKTAGKFDHVTHVSLEFYPKGYKDIVIGGPSDTEIYRSKDTPLDAKQESIISKIPTSA